MAIKKKWACFLLGIIALSVNLCSCTPLTRIEKSKFDGSKTVVMDDIIISNLTRLDEKEKVFLRLHWDSSITKNESLAIITMQDDFLPTKESYLNIFADGEKFKIPMTDKNKSSNVEYIGGGIVASQTVNRTILLYNIPDKVLSKIANSKEAGVNIKFAQGKKFENSLDFSKKYHIGRFYQLKSQ